MKKIYETNTNDYLLAALIIILSALPLLASDIFSGSGSTALVYKDNRLAYTLPLSEDREIVLGKMVIQVNNGKVRVEYSDCPQKICVHAGWISRPSEKIVCLPNKVLIEIEGAPKNKQVDVISY